MQIPVMKSTTATAARIFAAVAFALAFAAAPASANTVTLECTPQAESNMPGGVHRVCAIDYDANNVRQYALNDNGAPAMVNNGVMLGSDTMYPAQISDQEIKWSVSGTNTQGTTTLNYTLGRYTGPLMIYAAWTDSQGPKSMTIQAQCQPYTPPNQQRKF